MKQKFFTLLLAVAASIGTMFATVSSNLTWTPPSGVAVPDLSNTRLRVVGANAMNYLSDFEAINASCKTQEAFDEKTNKMANAFLYLQADVIALYEVQQDDYILEYLVEEMNKIYGKNVYNYILDGSQYNNPSPGNYGSIKCGYIYRSDKLTEGSWYTTNINDPTLKYRMIATSFTEKLTGEQFVLAVNHFTSHNADQSGSKRNEQAEALITYLKNNYGDRDILIVGDLNAESKETCVQKLINAGYTEQMERFDAAAYTYNYYGQKQLIDHVLANNTMAQQITGAYPYHINTAGGSSYSFSDHDCYVIGINLRPLYDININVNNNEMGAVTTSFMYDNSVLLQANANKGYRFKQWSDGNIDNPRTIELIQDTTFTAIFDYILTGNCGQNNVLTWTLDTTSLLLKITGGGALSENYTYGTFIRSLIIDDEITQIGEDAFANFVNLRQVTLGTGVKVLEQKAFYGCSAIETIICYSQRPPTVNTNALYGLSYSTVVYVPSGYLENYQMHDAWGLYDVRPLGATPTTTDDVKVEPTETTAVVVWPIVDGAASYELVIKDKDGNVICTFIFNEQGQLVSVAFDAPGHRSLHQTQTAGFSFLVTGLDSGTSYELTLTTKNSSDETLDQKVISFMTSEISAFDQTIVNQVTTTTKVIRNGRLYILRDGKTYSVQGQEVR